MAAAALSWAALPAEAFSQEGGRPAASGQPFGANWRDAERMPEFFEGIWQSTTLLYDAPATIEYTDAAKAHMATFTPLRDIPLAGANCKPPGMPMIQRSGSPLKFTFAPGMISIYMEQSSMTRFIRLNAEHSAEPDASFLGESVGHFEGDTLVVDTIGLREDTVFQYGAVPTDPAKGFWSGVILGPHGPGLRLVERIRLRDPDTLEIKLTVHDDTVFKTPYEVQPIALFRRLRGEEGRPGEFVCETAIATPFDSEKNESISRQPEDTLRDLGLDPR